MGPWFRQFEALIWAASIAVGVLIYALGALATKDYVNLKHESVTIILTEIREDVKEIKAELKAKK